MTIQTCQLRPETLDAFRPYLLTQVIEPLQNGSCSGFGVCADELAFGAIAFSISDEGIELRSLYIDPKMRRHLAATQLVYTLHYLAIQLGIETLFLSYSLPTAEENRALDLFLQTCLFEPATLSAKRYCIRADSLPCAAFFARLQGELPDENSLPFSALSAQQLEILCRMTDPPPYLRVQTYMPDMDMRVSHAFWQEDSCLGYVLFTQEGDVYRLAAAYSSEKSRGVFLRLLARCYTAFVRTAPAQSLQLSAINSRTARLTERLLQGATVQRYDEYESRCTCLDKRHPWMQS